MANNINSKFKYNSEIVRLVRLSCLHGDYCMSMILVLHSASCKDKDLHSI